MCEQLNLIDHLGAHHSNWHQPRALDSLQWLITFGGLKGEVLHLCVLTRVDLHLLLGGESCFLQLLFSYCPSFISLEMGELSGESWAWTCVSSLAWCPWVTAFGVLLSPLVPVWQDEWKPERLHSFGLYVLRTLFLWYLLWTTSGTLWCWTWRAPRGLRMDKCSWFYKKTRVDKCPLTLHFLRIKNFENIFQNIE